MGDEYGSKADFLLQALELLAQTLADLRIERGERLVEQQQLGLQHQGAGKRHALLLAARKGCGRALARGRVP